MKEDTVIRVDDLSTEDFKIHKGKVNLLNKVGVYQVIMGEMVESDNNIDNRNCTFNKHSANCTIHLKFKMKRDSNGIEYIGSLPNECPPILARIDYDTPDGGNVYIKTGSRGILAKGLKKGVTYNLTMLGWLRV